MKISREDRHEHSLVVIKSDSFAELALFLFITVKKLGTICTISLSVELLDKHIQNKRTSILNLNLYI